MFKKSEEMLEEPKEKCMALESDAHAAKNLIIQIILKEFIN